MREERFPGPPGSPEGATAVRARLTPEERRANKLASHQKYNASSKGQKRNKRYEQKHPERQGRWESARNAMRPAGQGGGGGAMR